MSAAGPWRESADTESVRVFAAALEPYYLNFSSRLPGVSGFSPVSGSTLAVVRAEGSADRKGDLRAACLFHRHGIIAPCLGGRDPDSFDPASLEAIYRRIARRSAIGFEARSAIGNPAEISYVERLALLRPEVSVSYRVLALDARVAAASGGVREAGDRESGSGLTIRFATSDDLDELLPLRERYEREEVVTEIHVFDLSACRKGLARLVGDRAVAIALTEGRIVGSAAINARGIAYDQVGGVYVEGGRRNRGIGKALMRFLVSDIARRGRNACLFVKVGNVPARALYESMGFADSGPLDIRYYI